ncbi:MAG: ribonuclease BN (tRNA processing enzyme) [Planctomycetota bacterium]|jgi:ribonuclease BN (tRNA processing enzyme)
MGDGRDKLRVRLLPSSMGSREELQYATSYLINEFLAVDAGSIGYQSNLKEQAAVRHVLLTHTHSDHVASLPVLVENTLSDRREPLVVWGNAAVLECIESDLFNDRIYPTLDVFRVASGPAVVLRELRPEEPIEIEGLNILPVEMNHTVPTLSFLIDDGEQSVVIGGDTGPTERLWELARGRENLVAVFLEAAFPNELRQLAQDALHLTPEQFAAEWKKLGREVHFLAVHLKPRYRATLVRELLALGLPGFEIGGTGKTYSW